MNADKRHEYFQELTLNLQRGGFTVGPEADGHLPVELDGRPLCLALDTGWVRYWMEDVAGDSRHAALEQVTGITRTTAEYMALMEAAPQLTARSLEGDYRLLSDFNGVVLAGHPTRYGVQFVTWERSLDQTSLEQGRYYGPGGGTDSYTFAKQDFAVRAGLIPHSALFAPEQLAEIYRCIHETLYSGYPITDERRNCLEDAAEQIEDEVPDLDERVALSQAKELDAVEMASVQSGGMRFC